MTKKYPEHEKMRAVKSESQTIGEFLEWLENEKKLHLGYWHEHNGECWSSEDKCGLTDRQLNLSHIKIEQLLADYFDIDLKKISEEKDAMYRELRTKATQA